MAIQTKKDQNLVETLVVDKAFETSKNNPTDLTVNTKKTSFLRSVITEVSKAKWPGLKYVVTWSLLVVLFTGVFSIILGTSDHIFESGVNFVSCSSPKGKNRDLSTCSQELAKKIFLVSDQ